MTVDPIKEGFNEPPPTYPLGVSIADKVSIQPIPKRMANDIHEIYHSYIATRRHNSVVNHGVFLDGELAGAISYAYLLASADICGYESDEYVELARVTIANDTPNLASCALSQSQDEFAAGYATEHGIGLLVTYIHEEWDGTMFRALQTKGWKYNGESPGLQAGNRADNKIRDVDKSRWVCEIPDDND